MCKLRFIIDNPNNHASYAHAQVHDGKAHHQLLDGELKSLTLASHSAIHHVGRADADTLRQAVHQNLALNRLEAAWSSISEMKQDDPSQREAKANLVRSVAKKALEVMDLKAAVRAYRQLRDVSMVMALTDLEYVEDNMLLAGHLYMLQGNYEQAKTRFLKSSQPRMALEMYRLLFDWSKAAQFGPIHAPEEMPVINREYAQSLEIKQEYAAALEKYELALQNANEVDLVDNERARHAKLCNAGIARMTLRLGNLSVGIRLAQRSGLSLSLSLSVCVYVCVCFSISLCLYLS